MRPTPSQIAKLKALSVLGPEETDELVDELIRISDRDAAIAGDAERFTEILVAILPKPILANVLTLMDKWSKKGRGPWLH
jgi:DNA-directed RNA polymerase subunit F